MQVLIVGVGGLILFFLLFYATAIWPTKWLRVERVLLPLGAHLKVLQISDIHIERNRIAPRRILQVIQDEQPDIICLTGDFLDFHSSFVLLVPFLKMIRATQVKTYAVLGNHDYRLAKPELLKTLLGEFGIRLLVNETEFVGGVNLVGIDDFQKGHPDESILADVKGDSPIVVMTHDPTITLYMSHRFDYLIAGHLHGKQFNLPYVFYLMDMGPLAKSGVYQGMHHSRNGTFYISKGVGQSGVNLRFLVRSEVTVHEL